MTEALEQIPDAELIAAVRVGDVRAFGVLYERHLVAAKRAANCLANTPAEREDLVAEAFTRVLRMLREGRGPDEEFRPYLLVTLRNTAIHTTRRGAAVSLYADVPDVSPTEAADPVIDRWHADVAADAFASLPERWRVVLWHTEVENESPAQVAPLLGMRPNGVAALAYRAREGLRQAYLRMRVPEPPRPECQPTARKLAGYVRHSIPLPLSRRIDKHLNGCAECRARADALSNVNAELRAVIGPIVLGAPLAAAYLSAPAVVTGAVSGALSVASGAAAAGAAGAAGSAGVVGTAGMAGVAGVASGTMSGAAVAVASDAAAPTLSGLLAVKATMVQVVAAAAVAATTVTMSTSVPAASAPLERTPVAAVVQATTPGTGTPPPATTPRPHPAAHPKTSTPATVEVPAASTAASGKAAAKQAKKEAKQAKKAAKKADATAKPTGAATHHKGDKVKPPKKSKDKKAKHSKVKKHKKHKKK